MPIRCSRCNLLTSISGKSGLPEESSQATAGAARDEGGQLETGEGTAGDSGEKGTAVGAGRTMAGERGFGIVTPHRSLAVFGEVNTYLCYTEFEQK